jgi:predicted nucleotidyltransferase
MSNSSFDSQQQASSEPLMVDDRRVALELICRQMGVAALYAFGSRAREIWSWLEQRQPHLVPGPSDIDIGVKLPPGVNWTIREKAQLAIALEDFFNCSRVDLVVLDEADPFVAVEVIRGERLFARDEYAADEYELYVLRRAGDLAPLEHERLTLILGEAP